MKIVILNGSPRKGNTYSAIKAFVNGANASNEIDIIDTDKVNLSGCKGCGSCQCSKGCVAIDDEEYTLIESQFKCMAKYLSWEIKSVRNIVQIKEMNLLKMNL